MSDMDELKELITMISHLPALTVWVLVGFLVYKLAVVGSIYGVIRLAIERLFSYLHAKANPPPPPPPAPNQIRAKIDSLCITGVPDDLIAQLRRVAGKGLRIQSSYIHDQSVAWLAQAISDKERKDIEAELEAARSRGIREATPS